MIPSLGHRRSFLRTLFAEGLVSLELASLSSCPRRGCRWLGAERRVRVSYAELEEVRKPFVQLEHILWHR